jgi:hypothetical protein
LIQFKKLHDQTSISIKISNTLNSVKFSTIDNISQKYPIYNLFPKFTGSKPWGAAPNPARGLVPLTPFINFLFHPKGEIKNFEVGTGSLLPVGVWGGAPRF